MLCLMALAKQPVPFYFLLVMEMKPRFLYVLSFFTQLHTQPPEGSQDVVGEGREVEPLISKPDARDFILLTVLSKRTNSSRACCSFDVNLHLLRVFSKLSRKKDGYCVGCESRK